MKISNRRAKSAFTIEEHLSKENYEWILVK